MFPVESLWDRCSLNSVYRPDVKDARFSEPPTSTARAGVHITLRIPREEPQVRLHEANGPSLPECSGQLNTS